MSKENHHEEEVKQNEAAQAAEPQTEKTAETAEEQELTSEEKLQKELDAANQALEEQKTNTCVYLLNSTTTANAR